MLWTVAKGINIDDFILTPNGLGSWPFVISALIFLAIGMVYTGRKGFDPYPFILLNLTLYCK